MDDKYINRKERAASRQTEQNPGQLDQVCLVAACGSGGGVGLAGNRKVAGSIPGSS